MMKCFDKRVLIGLAAVALGAAVLAPQFALAALPLLFLAACPLSMMLMMRGSHGQGSSRGSGQDAGQIVVGGQETELARLREEINILKAQQRIDPDRDPARRDAR